MSKKSRRRREAIWDLPQQRIRKQRKIRKYVDDRFTHLPKSETDHPMVITTNKGRWKHIVRQIARIDRLMEVKYA